MYSKSIELLNSMALRYSHDFPLLSVREKRDLQQKMSDVYDLYSKKLSKSEISKELNIYSVSLEQIIEEIDGKGFFQPKYE